ncbi:MAG: hypothetical protein EBR01_00835 [Proteobacteria bacterium]|nr:hypothetical protein [Pseudomonadota bacterium]
MRQFNPSFVSNYFEHVNKGCILIIFASPTNCLGSCKTNTPKNQRKDETQLPLCCFHELSPKSFSKPNEGTHPSPKASYN